MLNVGRIWAKDCQWMTRRSFLEIGSCSALGLSLPQSLAGAEQDSTQASNPRARSVILLWLWGGPSHHETWDPKPNAASPIRTRTPGMTICELLPQLAGVSNLYAIIRSMHHDQSDHNVAGTISLTGSVAGAAASGGVPFPGTVRPTMGSMVVRYRRGKAAAIP